VTAKGNAERVTYEISIVDSQGVTRPTITRTRTWNGSSYTCGADCSCATIPPLARMPACAK
jgi:hypothetical protein